MVTRSTTERVQVGWVKSTRFPGISYEREIMVLKR